MTKFIDLLAAVAANDGSPAGTSATSSAIVDNNICCFSTGKLYTEALLGVGLARSKNNLATAGELLSKEASFEFFLPVWINATHAEKSQQWRKELRNSYMSIGTAVYSKTDEDDAILEVFPRLINQLIVEMMRPDASKSEAIATFEAMTNFWRTFKWLMDSRPSLSSRASKMLSDFTKSEANRHKDKTPDLGMILVLMTVLQGQAGCPTHSNFIDAYLDENSLRWVMWWQRAQTPAQSGPVFQATKVSREICMFQLMVVDEVIGDVVLTLKEIEASNCKLPARLENLQSKWRQRKSSVDSWEKYFQEIGASGLSFASTDDWIAACVRRAAEKGSKYGNSVGKGNSGKGGYGGKSGGKGGKGGKGGRW